MSPVSLTYRSPTKNSRLEAMGALDIVVDGVSLTARAGKPHGLNLLAEMGHALGALLRGRSSRATAQLSTDGDAWELGLERDADDLLLSVFRSGPCPEVAVIDRRVQLDEFRVALVETLETALAGRLPAGHRGVLESSLTQLRRPQGLAKALPRGLVSDRVVVGQNDLVFRADASFRVGSTSAPAKAPLVERADLHALLVPGKMVVSLGNREIAIHQCQLFLVSERLLWLAEDALDSWQVARPLFRRITVEGLRLGVRRGPGDGPLSLSIATLSEGGGVDKSMTLNEISTTSFVETVSEFAEKLCERLITHDGAQETNLRLRALRQSSMALRSKLAELVGGDALTNDEPESFQSYGVPRVAPSFEGMWSRGGRMQFAPKWVAAVPQVDLAATFLYGKSMIVGSAREVAALSTDTGEVKWRVESERAATVATPVGIARLHADGQMRLFDKDSGDVRLNVQLTPRSGGGAAGALVNMPGLPQLLLVAEGDRTISAVDLKSGDVRWRHHASRPARLRLRRAGRLVLISGGDSALSALDVTTGEVVWKVRDRLPFSGDIAITDDSAWALSTSNVGAARLHRIDLWTGKVRWTAHLDEAPAFGQKPMVNEDTVVVVTRDRRGTGLTALDRETGEERWELEPGLSAGATAWIGVEDRIIGNSAAGTLMCLTADRGEAVYNQVFSASAEADQPRRIEPVLQNGALFVPQGQVEVLRPRDGEIIGTIPCDLVPDVVKVDRNCNAYVVEESGHVVAYSARPELSLVR